MKKLIIVAIGTIFIFGCNSNFWLKPKPKPKSVNTVNTTYSQRGVAKHCDLDIFDSIVIGGNSKVELVNGTCTIDVEEGYYDCRKNVKGRTLHINSPNSDAAIKVGVYELKKLIVQDNAEVCARDLRTDNLTIIAKGSGSINLQGKFKIGNISQFSRGMIHVEWIDNDKIHIEGSGSGPIYLAGRVHNMLAKLRKNSQLNARHLRVREASVFTTDRAIAEILVLDNLKAYAVDASNIYYYKRPKDLTVVTRDTGNVLHPDWMR